MIEDKNTAFFLVPGALGRSKFFDIHSRSWRKRLLLKFNPVPLHSTHLTQFLRGRWTLVCFCLDNFLVSTKAKKIKEYKKHGTLFILFWQMTNLIWSIQYVELHLHLRVIFILWTTRYWGSIFLPWLFDLCFTYFLTYGLMLFVYMICCRLTTSVQNVSFCGNFPEAIGHTNGHVECNKII